MVEEEILRSNEGENAIERARVLLSGEKEASKPLELPNIMKLVEKMTAPAATVIKTSQQPSPSPSKEIPELPRVEVKKTSKSNLSEKTILILMGVVGTLILALAAYLVFLIIG